MNDTTTECIECDKNGQCVEKLKTPWVKGCYNPEEVAGKIEDYKPELPIDTAIIGAMPQVHDIVDWLKVRGYIPEPKYHKAWVFGMTKKDADDFEALLKEMCFDETFDYTSPHKGFRCDNDHYSMSFRMAPSLNC